jgi:hypothetical protein
MLDQQRLARRIGSWPDYWSPGLSFETYLLAADDFVAQFGSAVPAGPAVEISEAHSDRYSALWASPMLTG